MKLKPLLIIPSLLIGSSAFAARLADSVGVENQDGKKVILHKLDPKDNYYSIGRRYNVKPSAIMSYNNNTPLHVGQVIKVPTDVPFVQSSPAAAQAQTRPAPAAQQPYRQPQAYVNPRPTQQQPPAAQNQQNNAPQNTANTQEYKVSAGETLYAIARRFNSSVGDIITLNNLKTNNLAPGQILLVPAGNSPAPAQQQQSAAAAHALGNAVVLNTDTSVAKRDSTSVAPADSAAERRYSANRYGLFERNEKGVATWMDDAGLDASKKLVLHRTAPIGTVIKITNPMTNRTTFAKVVGRFTDNESTKDVLIVMTKNAAESLGALDKRFRVNISYGVPDNE